jgi:hypothetical protein
MTGRSLEMYNDDSSLLDFRQVMDIHYFWDNNHDSSCCMKYAFALPITVEVSDKRRHYSQRTRAFVLSLTQTYSIGCAEEKSSTRTGPRGIPKEQLDRTHF